MPSYVGRLRQQLNWQQWPERYPVWANGYGQWIKPPDRPDLWHPELPQPGELQDRLSGQPGFSRPRVFVSHRQGDEDYAERIAKLADDAGFEFWLDTINMPAPARIANMSAVAVATVVELGLLNSSHLLAVYSDAAEGSTWIPYEYGRVKEPVLSSTKASAWKFVKKTSTVVPEWLSLNPVHDCEQAVKDWFTSEMRTWRNKNPNCPQGSTGDWTKSTNELPRGIA